MRPVPVKRPAMLIILLVALTSCFGGGGVYHTVRGGETLWRISRTYDVKIEKVIRANHIRDPRDINIGTRLYIPGAKRRLKVPPAGVKTASRPSAAKRTAVKYRGGFLWPVKGRLLNAFGTKDGIRNDGIDILARDNTPVKAAREGRVVYVADTFRTYGKIIIIKHSHDIYTVYANIKTRAVSKGDEVKKGETIAKAGSKETRDTFIHFEVREGKDPVNPLFFLPRL